MFNIIKSNQPIQKGWIVLSILFATLFLYPAGSAWAQTPLIFDETLHYHHFNNDNKVQSFMVPTNISYAKIRFSAVGADGGVKKNHSNGEGVAKGGLGALMEAWFEIGWGANQIPPGSEILFIPGQKGDNEVSIGVVGAAGGGGSGILYKHPTTNIYTCLMIAGGGAGGFADCCTVVDDGDPGHIYSCDGCEADDSPYITYSGHCSICFGGGGVLTESRDNSLISGGHCFDPCVGNDNCPPPLPDSCYYGKKGWPGATTFPSSSVRPTGGNGGSACDSGIEGHGGFGFGGGSSSVSNISNPKEDWANSCKQTLGRRGGGGGAAPNTPSSDKTDKDGGNSWINTGIALASPAPLRIGSGSTFDPYDGYVRYMIINDPPVAVCSNQTITLGSNLSASLTAAAAGQGSYDLNTPNAITYLISLDGSSPTTILYFDCDDVGTHSASVIVSDGKTSDTCSFTLTILSGDVAPPVVSCQDVTVYLDVNGFSANDSLLSQSFLGVTDNCDNSPAISYSGLLPYNTCADVGVYSATITGTDFSNNQGHCNFTFTVLDTIAPVVHGKDITVYLQGNTSVTVTNPGLMDNGSTDGCGTATYACVPNTFYCVDADRSNPVTLYVTDIYGNTGSGPASVTVLDTTPPIVVTKDITVSLDAGGTASISPSSVIQSLTECSGGQTQSVVPNTFDCSDLGPNTVTLTIADRFGNTTVVTANVTVTDGLAPTLTCPTNKVLSTNTGNCSRIIDSNDQVGLTNVVPSVPVPYGWYADNCEFVTATNDYNASGTLAGAEFQRGNTQVTWTVSDGANQTNCTFTIQVVDGKAPTVVSCPDSTNIFVNADSLTCRGYYNFGQPVFQDDCDSNPATNRVGGFNVEEGFPLGVTVYYFMATDSSGNTSGPACQTFVWVSDSTPPAARCVDTFVLVMTSFSSTIGIPSAALLDDGSFDACGSLNYSLSKQTFGCADAGPNQVTLTVTDDAGFTSSCQSIVMVDDVPPVITCKDITVDVKNGPEVITPQSVLLDYDPFDAGYCNIITPPVLSLDRDDFDCTDVGVPATVTLTAVDYLGRSQTCQSSISVIDGGITSLNCLGVNVILTDGQSQTVDITTRYSASDYCGGIVSVIPALDSVTVTCADYGQSLVLVTATDANGNTATCNVAINVTTTLNIHCNDFTVELNQELQAFVAAAELAYYDPPCPLAPGSSSIEETWLQAIAGFPDVSGGISYDITDTGQVFTYFYRAIGIGYNKTCFAHVTVIDNQNPRVNLSISSDNGSESAATMITVTATASAPVSGDQSVDLVIGGTGISGGDYLLNNSVIMIPNGMTSGSVTLTVVDDPLVEGPETATLTISNPSDSLTLGQVIQQFVAIEDNDTAFLTFTPPVNTTDESAGTYSGNVQLVINSSPSGGAVQDAFTVPLVAEDQSAVSPDDYSLISSDVTFPAGASDMTTQAFSISIVDDHRAEPTEDFNVLMDTAGYTGLALIPLVPLPGCPACVGSQTVAITDNDPPGIMVTESGGSTVVYEGAFPDTYELVLNSMPSSDVTVFVNTDVQTTADPAFFIFTPANWDSARTVTVLAVEDGNVEGPHTGVITHTTVSSDNDYNEIAVDSVVAFIYECAPYTASLSGSVETCPGATAYLSIELSGGISPHQINFISDIDTNTLTEIVDANGSVFPVVTYYSSVYSLVSVADAFGCPASISGSAAVAVSDVIPPVALCQDITIQLDSSGQRIVNPSEVDNGSSDNCGIFDVTLGQTLFGCADVGIKSVALTVTDFTGNMEQCNALITVEDNIPPEMHCRDITISLDASGNATASADSVGLGTFDACGLSDLNLDVSLFSCTEIGSNPVTLTAVDVNGNTGTCNATVTIQDNLAPAAICKDVTVWLDTNGDGNLTSADVNNGSSDACGISSVTLSKTSFGCSDVGIVSLTLTITDIHGNNSICNSNATVIDNVAPVVNCQDVTVSISAIGNAAVALFQMHAGSSDACGPVTNSIEGTAFNFVELNCANIGIYNVTILGTDIHGNTGSCNSHVTVNDLIAPVALCRDITVQLESDGHVNITPEQIDNGSSDNCGPVSRAINQNEFTCLSIGNRIVTLTVNDQHGHTASCVSNVFVSNTLNSPQCGFNKQIVSTSHAGSPETGDGSTGNERPVLIGETVTYLLQLEVPEGASNAVSLIDHIPEGMQYLSGSLVISNNADVGMTYSPVLTGGTIPGEDINLSLGNIFNNDTDAGTEYLDIQYQAVVLNVIGNQVNSLLQNMADLKINNTVVYTTEARTVVVSEPIIQATKAQKTSIGGALVTTADAGNYFVYTVHLSNVGDATAYDIIVSDQIPLQWVSLESCCESSANLAPSFSYDNLTGSWTVTIDKLEPGQSGEVGIRVFVVNNVTPGNSWSSQPASVTWTSLAGTSLQERNGDDGPGGTLNDYAVVTNSTPAIIVPPISMVLQLEHPGEIPVADLFNGQYMDATSDATTNYEFYDTSLLKMTIGESFNIIATITLPEGHYTSGNLQWFSGRSSPNTVYFTGEPVDRVVEITGLEIVHMGANLNGTLPSQANLYTIDSSPDGDIDGLGYRSNSWNFYNMPDGKTNDKDRLVLRYFCRMDDEDKSGGPADDLVGRYNQAGQKAGFRLGIYPNLNATFSNEPKIYFEIVEPSIEITQVITATDGAGILSGGNITGASIGDEVTLQITLTNNGSAPAYQVALNEAFGPRYDLVSVLPSQGIDSSDLANKVLFAELGSINPGASATVTVVARILSANKGVTDTLKACASYASLPADGLDIRKYSACGSTELTILEFCPDILVGTNILSPYTHADAGDTITLHITLDNNEATAAARQLTLTDNFTPGTLVWTGDPYFTGAAPDTFYIENSKFIAIWNSLDAGTSATMYIPAVLSDNVYPGQLLANTVTASSGIDCSYQPVSSATLVVQPIAIDLQLEYPNQTPVAEYFGGAYSNSTSDPFTADSSFNVNLPDLCIGETFNAIVTVTFPEGKIDKLRLLSFRASPHNSYFLGEPRDRVVQILGGEVLHTGANLSGLYPNADNFFMEDVGAYGDGDFDYAGLRRNSNSSLAWNFTNNPDNITNDDDRIIIRFNLRIDDEDESGGPADQLSGKYNAAGLIAGLRMGALPYDYQYIEEERIFMDIVEPSLVLTNSVVSTSGTGVIAGGDLSGAHQYDSATLVMTLRNTGSAPAYNVHLQASTEPILTIGSIDPGIGTDSSNILTGSLNIYKERLDAGDSLVVVVLGTVLHANGGTTDTVDAVATAQSLPAVGPDIRYYDATDPSVINLEDCAFTITQVSVTDPGCSNGSVAVTIAAAGSPDFVFTLFGPDTISNSTGEFNGLASANYTLSVVTADPPYCQRIWNDILLSSPADNTAPVAICRDVTVSLDSTGNAIVTPDMIDDGSYDDCGIASISLDRTVFTCADTGQIQIVMLIVDDNAGNIGDCQANLTVIDDTPPTALCKDITIQLDSTGFAQANVIDVNDGSYDNCGIPAQCGIVPPGEICTPGLVLSQVDFGCENVGPNPVVLTVNDSHGHSSTCNATVFVEDHVLPYAQCQDITIELNELGSTSITAEQINNGSYDACGVLSTQISVTSFDCSTVGNNNVVLSVTDNNGNTNSCTAIVTVEDNIQPTAICKNLSLDLDSNGEATVNPALADNGSNDACGIASFQLSPSLFNCTHLGTTAAVLVVTDNNDNTNTCTTQVTVEDKIIPSITCPDDITVVAEANECSVPASEVDLSTPTAADNCTVIYPFTNNAPSEYPLGNTIVKWFVNDQSNNKNNCKQKVTVQASSCGQPIQVLHTDTTENTAKIIWQASLCATNYQLRIRQEISPGVWGAWSSWTNYSGPGLQHSFTNLNTAKFHHYQIKSKCFTSNSTIINGWFWTLTNNNLKKINDYTPDVYTKVETANPGYSNIDFSVGLDLILAPNPTKELTQVKLEGFHEHSKQMIMMDLNGKLIFNITLAANENFVELDLRKLKLSSGNYWIRVFDGRKQKTKILIVVN